MYTYNGSIVREFVTFSFKIRKNSGILPIIKIRKKIVGLFWDYDNKNACGLASIANTE